MNRATRMKQECCTNVTGFPLASIVSAKVLQDLEK
jgi:hypothetical protein